MVIEILETLINIAKNTPELDYIFVSDNELLKNLQIANVKIYNGSWANSLLTDLELKALYEESKLTIIPLKNSTQPSGQSHPSVNGCWNTSYDYKN